MNAQTVGWVRAIAQRAALPRHSTVVTTSPQVLLGVEERDSLVNERADLLAALEGMCRLYEAKHSDEQPELVDAYAALAKAKP